MKCPVCNTRKPARSCPALNQKICSRCCGVKRNKVIQCEPNCSYLGKKEKKRSASTKNLVEKAVKDWETGNLEEALKNFDEALELNPESLEAITGKGAVLVDLGNIEEGLRYYDEALEINPKEWFALMGKGTVLMERGELEDALECFDRLLEIQNNPEALANRGFCLAHLGDYEDAIQDLERALKTERKNVFALINKGYAHLGLEQEKEAKACYEKASRIRPDERTFYTIGVNYSLFMYPLDAIEYLDKSLEINPKQVKAWLAKGESYEDLLNYEEALKCYEEALRIDRYDEEAHYNKIEALMEIDEFEDALKACEEAIGIFPAHLGFLELKTDVLLESGEEEKIPEVYEEIIDIDPSYENYRKRGYIYASLGKIDEALEDFDKGLELEPDDVLSWIGKSNAYVEKKNYEEALKCCEKALEIEPEDTIALGVKASILTEMERYKDSITTYDRFIELEDSPIAWFGKGMALYESGNKKEARKSFDNAIDRSIIKKEVVKNVSTFYFNQEEYETAFEYINKVSVDNPLSELVALKIEILNELGKEREAQELTHEFVGAIRKSACIALLGGRDKIDINGFKEAFKEMKDHLEFKESEPSYLCHNGFINLLEENPNHALKSFEKAIEHDNRLIEAYLGCSLALIYMDEREEALNIINKALHMKNLWSLLIFKSKILKDLGRLKEAKDLTVQLPKATNDIFPIFETFGDVEERGGLK